VAAVTGAPEASTDVATYHGQPVLQEPAWTWEVPVYFFTGGLAGCCSLVALAADAAGERALARRARLIAAAGAAVSPPLLIADLGRPARFLNMLRVFRPTSPMSIGSWTLVAYAPAAVGAAALELLGRAPRLRTAAGIGAGTLAPLLVTYTGVLFANTAVPVWHEARHHLPALFAASSAAAAGAATGVPALTVPAVAIERAIGAHLEHHVGSRQKGALRGAVAGRWSRAAKLLSVTGAVAIVVGARKQQRPLRTVGASMVLASSMCERFAMFRAGAASARDPIATIAPQRARVDEDVTR
jgi:DMSO reductase anchor subunit